MRKLLSFLAVAVLIGSGCDSPDPIASKPRPDSLFVRDARLNPDILFPGDTAWLEGTASASAPLKLESADLVTLDTLGMKATGVTVLRGDPPATKSWDLRADTRLRVVASPAATEGSLQLRVRISAGDTAVVGTLPFFVQARPIDTVPILSWSGFQLTRSGMPGGKVSLRGVVISNVDIDSITLEANAPGFPVSEGLLKPQWNAIPAGTRRWDMDATGAMALVDSLLALGDYQVTARAWAGGTSVVSSPAPFRLLAWDTPALVSTGAQGSAIYGTSMDLDVPTDMKSAAAHANPERIDLAFVYSNSSLRLMTPRRLKQTDLTYAAVLDSSKLGNTPFVKLTAVPTRPEEAFHMGTRLEEDQAVAGSLYVMKSTEGKWLLIRVDKVDGTDMRASAILDVRKLSGEWLPD